MIFPCDSLDCPLDTGRGAEVKYRRANHPDDWKVIAIRHAKMSTLHATRREVIT